MPCALRPRGALLVALALCAAMTAAGEFFLLAASPLQTTLAVMIPLGAFLASLPGRIHKRGVGRSTRMGCVKCFAAGLVMALIFGLSGYEDGRLLTGLAQGSVSAWAFALTALGAGLIARALQERRRKA